MMTVISTIDIAVNENTQQTPHDGILLGMAPW